jgi:hypothetical protein
MTARTVAGDGSATPASVTRGNVWTTSVTMTAGDGTMTTMMTGTVVIGIRGIMSDGTGNHVGLAVGSRCLPGP